MLLAGDVGGTKTDLAIFSKEQGPRAALAEATYPSDEHESLQAIASRFLAESNLTVDRASFGVAGPVVGGDAVVTNLPWNISEARLADALGLESVRLLNDLEAIAHAVPFLEAADLQPLNPGEAVAGGAIGVLAPGTGLGEAYLIWDGSQYRPQASEGGHADFAPIEPLQVALLQFLQERFEHVSYERIASGSGLPNIYAFLKETGRVDEARSLAQQLDGAEDPTPIIVQAALEENPPEICQKTLEIFVAVLGAEAGNLALKILATGGVYLAGGIPPRILPYLEGGAFLEAFARKGRFRELLEMIPIQVVTYPKVALLGAALHGLELQL
ncbi:MAG: glucokinase [Anaerolineae bacterium]